MKKTVLMLMIATFIVACEKENEMQTIEGTVWVGDVYGDTATLRFLTSSVMTMEINGETVQSSYSYNPELMSGTITDNTGTGTFTISGQSLVLNVEGMTYTFKKK